MLNVTVIRKAKPKDRFSDEQWPQGFTADYAGRRQTVVLSAAWVASITCADTQPTPAMRPHHMPLLAARRWDEPLRETETKEQL